VSARRSQWTIWRWPAGLAALTVFGLLSALLGQGGVWWAMSWAALAIPLIVISVFVGLRQRPRGSAAR
jgi:hypothetical protein